MWWASTVPTWKLSRPQWTELERLVRSGGSRPLEVICWSVDEHTGDVELWGGRDAGREDTFRALVRRGFVEVGFDREAPTPPVDHFPMRMTITGEGRAAIAAHKARRGHPTPATWKRRGAA